LRYFRRALFAFAIPVLVSSLFAITLNYWSEDTVAGSDVERALFRDMDFPGGAVLARRPPGEATAQLDEIIKQKPDRSDLYVIRAEEEERNLQIEAAESDWRKAAELASNRSAALIDLADFYKRRLEPIKEVSALLDAGKLASSGMDRYRPETMQLQWHAFERATSIWKDARLAPAVQDQIYEAWIARYPKSREPYSRYLDALVHSKDKDKAQTLVNRIATQFADEAQFRLQTEAKLASIHGGSNAELSVYSKHFSVLWPAPLRRHYYDLLRDTHQLRTFLSEAQRQSVAIQTR
jgi:hypothetical protein